MSPEPITRAHPEPVVLNIGGALGALIIHWDAAELDTPIEISPTGHDEQRQHQHILERPLKAQTLYAAVFDTITEGHYTLWVANQPRAHDVLITGGQITELHWDTAASTPR